MHRTFAVFFGLNLMLFGILSPPGNAQEISEDYFLMSLEELLNAEVTTASKTAEAVRYAPGMVIVVGARQIQEQGYTNLVQVLKDLPGIDVQENSAQAQLNIITGRGFYGNNRFIIMQDGIRITDPTGAPIPIDENFPVQHLKQIEVVFGPASALYGADAFCGIINLITKDASDIDGGTISLSSGEHGYKRAAFNLGKEFFNSRLSFVGGGTLHDANNIPLNEEYPEEFTLNDLVTFGGETVRQAEERTYRRDTKSHSFYAKLGLGDLTLGVNHSQFDQPPSIGARPNTTDYNPNPRWITKLGSLYAKYDYKLSDQLNTMARFNHGEYELDHDSRFVNIYVDFQDGYKYAKGEKDQLELQLDYKLNGTDVVVVGLNYEQYYALPKTPDLPSPFDPDKGAGYQGLYYPGTDDSIPIIIPEVNYENYGVLLQWQRLWTDSLCTTLGVRYDRSSTYGDSTNPRLSVVYSPTKKTTVKFLYGSAFLAPAPHFSYSHYGSFSGSQNADGLWESSFFHIPNPGLQPETIDTFEVNLNHHFSENVILTIAPFFSRADDMIHNRAATPQQPDYIPGGTINFTQWYDNIGKAEAYGFDTWLEALVKKGNHRLQFTLSYSFLDGEQEVETEGYATDLPFTAKHKVKLNCTYNYDRFTITPCLRWIGKTNTEKGQDTDPTRLQTVSDYTVFDIFTKVEIGKGMSCFLEIHNLFDEKYYNAGGVGGQTFVEAPQDTRMIKAGLQYAF